MTTRTPLGTADIPELVKHVTLAIFKKGKIPGPRRDRFRQALEIAKAQLAEQGFLIPNDPRYAMTGKGAARSRQHTSDAGASGKRAQFDKLYSDTFLTLPPTKTP